MRTFLLAGFALNIHLFSPLNGLTPSRALVAGFFYDLHLQKSGQREQAVTSQTLLDRGAKRVKHGSDLLL